MRPYSRGFEVQLEADEGTLRGFESQLMTRFPVNGDQFTVQISAMPTRGDTSFRLIEPEDVEISGSWILPDTGQCSECISEMLNPNNRRFFYPFTFCADCGPRYSLAVEGLIRREDTVLKGHPLCEQCLAEVGNSRDRRFLHALNTCPICGPSVGLLDHSGIVKGRQREALIQAAAALEQGRLLAVKEPSGYSLVALATLNEPVRRLRGMLDKPHEPIPIVVSSPDAVDAFAVISKREQEWLQEPMSPLLRLRKRGGSLSFSDQVAPFGDSLEIGLPATGMLQLLINLLNLPLAVVSDLRHRLPYSCHETEALNHFDGQVDFMLMSELPVLRSTPKSLIQSVAGKRQILKQGTGLVPIDVILPEPETNSLALGGGLQTSLGINIDDRAFLLGQMGELKGGAGLDYFFDNLQDTKKLFNIHPAKLKIDADPQALTTRYALSTETEFQKVEHDLAHVMSVLSEEAKIAHLLGVCFDDSVGIEKQETLGGGSCLWLSGQSWQRIAGFGSFLLPGGEPAMGDNRASLFGMLYEAFGSEMWEALPLKLRAQLNAQEMERWDHILKVKLQCRRTCSVTQWWQGLASLLIGCHRNRFQGYSFAAIETAMDLELDVQRSVKPYPVSFKASDSRHAPIVFDWCPMLKDLVTDIHQGRHCRYIFSRVFETFARWLLKLSAQLHPKGIVLSGSAFENRIWTSHLVVTLEQHGFRALLHDRLPCNDASLAMGQMVATARRMDLFPSRISGIENRMDQILSQSPTTNRTDGKEPEVP